MGKEIKNSNKVFIRSVMGNVEQKYFIQPVRNPETGLFAECVRAVNSKGEMILSEKDREDMSNGAVFIPENKTFEIVSGMEIDLNKKYDRAMWDAIKHCPGIASDRYEKDADGNFIIDGNAERYGVAELYIENPTLEAKREVDNDKNIFEAKRLIYDDKKGARGRLAVALILGRDMSGYDDYEVTDFLTKYAERNPEKIKTLYSGDELSLRILFLKAKEKRIIKISGGTYVYGLEGQYILGTSDDAAINFLKNPSNNDILEQIKVDLNPDMFNREVNKPSPSILEEDENPKDEESEEGFDAEKIDSVEQLIENNKKRNSKKQ